MNTGYMSEETRNDVVVIGGGAAGMMAALFCAREGAKTLLLERNEKLGKKIYITGKGRCNLTNTAEPEQFLREIPHNGRFMLSPLSHLNNEGTIRLFNTLGLATKVERGGRVFPVSDKASDVTKTLHRALDAAGVKILLNSHVERISCSEGLFTIDTANGKRIFSSALILATGGASYPATGSTGDGYRFAEAMGHRVYAPVPSLVGMNMNSAWHERLQGLTLKNVTITAKTGKKVIYHELGEVLFTHFGISGPLILTLSAHMPDHAEDTAVTLNMKPGMTPEELDKRLIRELTENSRKQLNTILNSFLYNRVSASSLSSSAYSLVTTIRLPDFFPNSNTLFAALFAKSFSPSSPKRQSLYISARSYIIFPTRLATHSSKITLFFGSLINLSAVSIPVSISSVVNPLPSLACLCLFTLLAPSSSITFMVAI